MKLVGEPDEEGWSRDRRRLQSAVVQLNCHRGGSVAVSQRRILDEGHAPHEDTRFILECQLIREGRAVTIEARAGLETSVDLQVKHSRVRNLRDRRSSRMQTEPGCPFLRLLAT